MRPQRLRLRLATERWTSGEELVQDTSERVLIRAGVHPGESNLLRCEIVERARESTGGRGRAGAQLGRQPEVGQVAVISTVHEDVSRLHVTVDEPTSMRRVEGVGDLAE